MTSTITHRPTIRKQQRGPLIDYRMYCPACGAASPWAADRDTAVLARDSHVREVGSEA